MTVSESGHGIARALCCALLMATLAGCSTPIGEQLSVADRALITRTTEEALEQGRTGEARNWENPETARRGTVVPTRTYGAPNAPCREFQQTLTIEGVTFMAFDTACRYGSGLWKSENYATLAGAIAEGSPYPYDRYYDPYYDPYYGPYYYPGYPYGRHRHFYGGYGHYW